jgi:hypothetical protein
MNGQKERLIKAAIEFITHVLLLALAETQEEYAS